MTRYRLQRWRNRAQSFIADVPNDVIDWLFDPGSLTTRLIKHCKGNFRVEVIAERYTHVSLTEARRLGMKNRETALVREVFLYCEQTPLVYAKTIIPISSLIGAQKRLCYLGNKSLGAVLFSDKTMRREEMQIAKLDAADIAQAASAKQTIWGRRSIFRLRNKPLMVSEYFLPELFLHE